MSLADHRASGFFALRTALLPYAFFGEWEGELAAPRSFGGEESALEAAIRHDRERLRRSLRELIDLPEIREALFVASPSLDERLPRWLDDPDSAKGRGIERALVRYFARMAGRSTPFGLFAGSSVGSLGSTTRLRLPDRSSYARRTRLDMEYLSGLVDELCKDRTLREQLTYRPNTSLYQAGSRLRYAEHRLRERERSYHLVAIEPDEYLERILVRARDGARIDDLIALLVDPEIEEEEARGFVHELIDSQLLVPDLEPPVTGPDALGEIIRQLEALPAAAGTAKVLDRVRVDLEVMDARGLGVPPQRYLEQAELLEGLPAKVELPRLFQVDMVKPDSGLVLHEWVVDELRRGADLLYRLFAPRQDPTFGDFMRDFEERYGDTQVPLVEALDEEIGIGFQVAATPTAEASPLLEGLAFPGADREETVRWGGAQGFVARKLAQALHDRRDEIVVEDEEVADFQNERTLPLPDAVQIMGSLVAKSAEAVDRGEFQVVLYGAAGPSGARLLGRFCHADEVLHSRVREHLQEEEQLASDALFLEVVHLPQGRVGNILARPLLRSGEIPFLGRSGSDPSLQIPITDLMVSIESQRIVLRLRTTGQRIEPRLTTAHNFGARSLGLYRFLCALQTQGLTGGLGWPWGALGSLPFLPRVRYGRCILSRAQWILDAGELGRLRDREGAALFREVQTIRQERALPRRLGLVDGDNVLPLDLDNVLSVETFADLVARRSTCTLDEMVPGPDELPIEGPEGRFVHEIVVPLVRKPPPESTDTGPTGRPPGPDSRATVVRRFVPGSSWLYVKLYTGTSAADRLLRDVVAPIVERSRGDGSCERWFFLRYADPAHHLRVRFLGQPQRLLSELLPALRELAQPFLETGELWRLQLDSYDREVRRYGGPEGIELAEEVFHVDSEAALALCGLTLGDEGADVRWRLTLRGMDDLLEAMGFDLADKHLIVDACARGFGDEFRVGGPFKQQIRDRFRRERSNLARWIDPKTDPQSLLPEALPALARRKQRLTRVFEEVRRRAEQGRLELGVADLAMSHLHMHNNRMMRAAPRAHEMVIYQFLERLYASQIARASQGKKNRG